MKKADREKYEQEILEAANAYHQAHEAEAVAKKTKENMRDKGFCLINKLFGKDKVAFVEVQNLKGDDLPRIVFGREYAKKGREPEIDPAKLQKLLTKKQWESISDQPETITPPRVYNEAKCRAALAAGKISTETATAAMDEGVDPSYRIFCRLKKEHLFDGFDEMEIPVVERKRK